MQKVSLTTVSGIKFEGKNISPISSLSPEIFIGLGLLKEILLCIDGVLEGVLLIEGGLSIFSSLILFIFKF
jgi:hypothetical protein